MLKGFGYVTYNFRRNEIKTKFSFELSNVLPFVSSFQQHYWVFTWFLLRMFDRQLMIVLLQVNHTSPEILIKARVNQRI